MISSRSLINRDSTMRSAPRPARSERLPLVLLPGTLCDERLFEPLIERLEGWPVIMGRMVGADSAAGLARANLAAAPEYFLLAGFSLGGIVALEMVAQAPGRVRKLALLNASPRPAPPERAGAPRRDVDEFILGNWDALVAPVNRERAGLKATILAMARSGGPSMLAAQATVAATRVDSRPRLSRIGVPTLVLGGEHEAVVPLDAQRETVAGIPGAEMAVVPDAGHFAPLENPDAVAHHMLRWLRGRDGQTSEESR